MPTIIVDPDTIPYGPRVIEPMNTLGVMIGYSARLLGDTSPGAGMSVPVCIVKESIQVEVTEAQLEVLEAFFEQVYSSRQPQKWGGDSSDYNSCGSSGSADNVPVR